MYQVYPLSARTILSYTQTGDAYANKIVPDYIATGAAWPQGYKKNHAQPS